MELDWQTIIISVLSSGTLAGFVTAVVNGLMNHRTKIKSIQEAGLYSRRADVLDNLVKLLWDIDLNTSALISIFQNDGSNNAEAGRREACLNSFNNFAKYFESNKHYLPAEVSAQVESTLKKYEDIFVEFTNKAKPVEGTPNIDAWKKLRDFKGEVEDNKENIIAEFRKVIGVK